jgi:hypothetical protein
MSATSPLAAPRRLARSAFWFGALALLWAAVIGLAQRGAKPRAFALYCLAAVLTYFGAWAWAVSVSRPARLTLFRGLRTTLTLVIILACLEAPAALGLVHWGGVFGHFIPDDDYIKSRFDDDPERGWRRPPKERWSGRPPSDMERAWGLPPSLREPITFTTDGGGYRNPADLERADVALIGDSFIEGWRVSDEQTAARLLQARLGRPVANLGVAGYGPMQELVVLKQDALRLKPAAVVWFFFEGNDLYDDANFEASLGERARGAAPASHQPWRRRSFTLSALRLLGRWCDPLLPGSAPYYGTLSLPGREGQAEYFADDAAMVPWGSYEAACWDRSRKALQQAADLCRAQGARLLFCYVPIKFRVYRPFVAFPPDSPCREWGLWPLPQLFADFCRSADVPCLDLTEPLQDGLRSGQEPYMTADTHWGPEGQALVADRLAQELRRRGWLADERAAR